MADSHYVIAPGLYPEDLPVRHKRVYCSSPRQVYLREAATELFASNNERRKKSR